MKVCQSCGGLFSTDPAESFAGTPCKCGARESGLDLTGKEPLTRRAPLLQRIDGAARRLNMDAGEFATKLYLGRAELEELKAYAETPEFVMGTDGEKSTFQGRTIFVVFDESHIAVGY